MLSFTHSSHSHQLSDTPTRAAASGLAAEQLSHIRSLQQPLFRLQNRSSAAQKNIAFSSASANTRQVNRPLALQGRNVSAVKVAGNGTPVVTSVTQMHNGGAWNFFSNGRFRFTPAGLGVVARTDLFPVVGTYRSTASNITFSGTRRSADLTSRNAVEIRGTIVTRNGGFRATVFQRTVIIMASVVNGISFSNTIDRTVRINMNMVRIR